MIINRNRGGGGGKETVTWHQCPEAVRNYLDQVTYDPSDYTASQIATYAPGTPVSSNTNPVGKTVDGVTYYNGVPNVNLPFSSTNKAGTVTPLDALRWIKTTDIENFRDLGGWACDGGTVKYGKLLRGTRIVAETDRAFLLNELHLGAELDLRYDADITTNPATMKDYIDYLHVDGNWYSLSDAEKWKAHIGFIFDCVKTNKTVWFHCAGGLDRTGTLACVLEGMLGISQSDIDKDYELGCFYSGCGSDSTARRRNESDWTGLITEINEITGNTFRDRCVNFVASLGFTASEINAFRASMIDGNPETVTPVITNRSVTNTLTFCTSDNSAVSVPDNTPYKAIITPSNGSEFESVSVKINGTNITSGVYEQLDYPSKKGRINIPRVYGDLTVEAVCSNPQPYITCEYLESTAADDGSYIDTGYVNTEHTGIEISMQFVHANAFGTGIIGNTDFYIGSASQGDMRAFKGGIKSYQLTGAVANDTDYNLSVNKDDDGKAYINGTEKLWNGGTPAYSKNTTITIGKCNGAPSPYSKSGHARYFTAAIYEAGVKVRNFVPTLRTSDNACGMMDSINNVFYPATGTFTASN